MKLFAAAALAASCFALPTLPVNAAPLLSDAEADCLILPMLKAECWALGAQRAEATVQTIADATGAVAADAAAATENAAADAAAVPLWWNCAAAPEGSGYLLEC
jgi:predicted RecA/RadA family phage recombinase